MDNAYFLTLRCSPLETQLFEDATTLILAEFRRARTLSYSVEKDGTPDVHLHLLVKTPARDTHHFKQVFNKKVFNDVQKLFKSKNTETNEHALKVEPMSDEHNYQRTLGYIYKEQFCSRRSSTHDSPYITESIKIYHAHKRIEERNIPVSKKILLSSKNFHSHIENFLSKNPLESVIHWAHLKKQMIISGYSFMDISDKKLRIAINELQICEDNSIRLLLSEDLEENKKINESYDPQYEDEECPLDLKNANYEYNQWCRKHRKKTEKYIYVDEGEECDASDKDPDFVKAEQEYEQQCADGY